jgi:hypothetical protein
VPWDSWRREDGRWSVVVSPAGFSEPATFLFDTKGRYVLPADEAAHELVGDFAITESSDMAIADVLRDAPAPPLEAEVSTPAEESPQPAELDIELPEALALPVPDELIEQPASVASLKEARDRRAQEQMADQIALSIDAGIAPAELDDVEITENHHFDAESKPKGKHERRRVPSWDEIMFGGARRD